MADQESLAMANYGESDATGGIYDDVIAERVNQRQMLFNKIGGDAIYAYLAINDTTISTPGPKDVQKFHCVSSDSLDVTFAMHRNASDFASVVVNLFTHDLGFEDAYAGQIRIWAKDIIEVTAKEHDEDALEALRRFCPKA